MAKNERGLPPNFQLDIPDKPREAPVQLDDFLDMEARPALPQRPAPTPKPPQRGAASGNVIQLPRTVAEPEQSPASEESGGSDQRVHPRSKKKKQKGPLRKQINATPETLRMIEDLIKDVQTYSVQKDAKASEVFHALVLSLYEAREQIDLSDVPARGKWGTPTAKSFPISLKNAFQEAIVLALKKNRRS